MGRVRTMHLSVPDCQAMFSAENTHHTHASHPCSQLQEASRVVFLLIAYANFISRVAVKVLLQSCSWHLDVILSLTPLKKIKILQISEPKS